MTYLLTGTSPELIGPPAAADFEAPPGSPESDLLAELRLLKNLLALLTNFPSPFFSSPVPLDSFGAAELIVATENQVWGSLCRENPFLYVQGSLKTWQARPTMKKRKMRKPRDLDRAGLVSPENSYPSSGENQGTASSLSGTPEVGAGTSGDVNGPELQPVSRCH